VVGVSERYPCVYGLRDHCEAIELAFRIATGEVSKAVELLTGVKAEPKTDEEKFVKKFVDAMGKYLPTMLTKQYESSVGVDVVRIIAQFCSQCPHRLAKLREFEAGELTLLPQPKEAESHE
jgi:hypothetical protein